MESRDFLTENEKNVVTQKLNLFERSESNKRIREYEMKMLLLFGEMVKEIHEISPGDRKC